ncbi:MAG TPA: hypothetical protein DCM38_04000 [Gammaproteobacteria bacterium]|nr:hypothetical protein [Gammaproteobacteria bacterium]
MRSLLILPFALLILGGCNNVETKILKELKKIENTVRPLAELMKSNQEPTPEPEVVTNIWWAEQGWTEQEREWFWHIPQGTQIMPYDWFVALERPKNEGEGLFIEQDYMMRFGFIPSQKTEQNPDNLPIGFVKDARFVNPMNGEKVTMAGITCAACHTGQINYNGEGLVIDGGPAMTNVTLFQDKVSVALFETLLPSRRFLRFAKRVLKDEYSLINAIKLLKEVKQFAEKNGQLTTEMINRHLNLVKEGFGRVDALSRIGNVVFGAEIDFENLRAISAPVSYPPLWTVPWFDWAQYNGSIRQPMVRNVGEALGVQAPVNLTATDKEQLFNSSVHVDNLHEIENLLAGDKRLSGLQAPKWPTKMLGPINDNLKQQGQKLYEEHCQKCHLPPVDSKTIMQDRYWEEPNKYGKRYLITHNIDLNVIGTDPAEVFDFYERQAETKGLGLGEIFANRGLQVVTEAVANKWYDENDISPEKRIEMNGDRENIVLSPLKYRARPLNGVWSTPPYLHNGSVPNLYELLSPWEERSKQFYVGSKEFEPEKVGFVNTQFTGAFLMDTTLAGNTNTGHEFNDAEEVKKKDNNVERKGIIGPKLTEKERKALIEYLKTL